MKIFLLVVGLLLLVAPTATAAVPDASFGASGLAALDVAGEFERNGGAALDAQGRVLLVGDAGAAQEWSAVRLLPTGQPDPSFGVGGRRLLRPAPGGPGRAMAVLPLQDGRMVLVGSWYDGESYDGALVMLQPNGSIDRTFGTNGTTLVQGAEGSLTLEDAALAPDGSIVAVGSTYGDNGDGSNDDMLIAHFAADGTPGRQDVLGYEGYGKYLHRVAVAADGSVTAVGSVYHDGMLGPARDIAIVNENSSGATVRALDVEGDPTALAVAPDSSLLVGGEFGLVRVGASVTSLADEPVSAVLPSGVYTSGYSLVGFGQRAPLDLRANSLLQTATGVLVAGTQRNEDTYDDLAAQAFMVDPPAVVRSAPRLTHLRIRARAATFSFDGPVSYRWARARQQPDSTVDAPRRTKLSRGRWYLTARSSAGTSTFGPYRIR